MQQQYKQPQAATFPKPRDRYIHIYSVEIDTPYQQPPPPPVLAACPENTAVNGPSIYSIATPYANTYKQKSQSHTSAVHFYPGDARAGSATSLLRDAWVEMQQRKCPCRSTTKDALSQTVLDSCMHSEKTYQGGAARDTATISD
jgi:hypothetical protein